MILRSLSPLTAALLAGMLLPAPALVAAQTTPATRTPVSLETPAPLRDLKDTAARDARIAAGKAAHGEFYGNMLGNFFKELEQRPPGGTLFLGDSITQGFPLATAFPGKPVWNHGIGGDRVLGAYNRVDVVALAQPEVVRVMIGANDSLWAHAVQTPPDVLEAQYRALFTRLAKELPKARVIVHSVLPAGGKSVMFNPRILEVNRSLRAIAAEFKLEYVDLQPALQGENGGLRPDFSVDGVHLTLAGYWAWTRAITPRAELFESALGFAPAWKKLHTPSFRAAKIDPPEDGKFPGNRGEQEMVIYTPKGPRTNSGTNTWGVEALVSQGYVTARSAMNSPIPSDGFVVSGHGEAAAWVARNLAPGVRVQLKDGVLTVLPRPLEALSPTGRVEALESRLMVALADLPTSDHAAARALFLELQAALDLPVREQGAAAARLLPGVEALEAKAGAKATTPKPAGS